jgi:hypothetical protein
MSRNFVQTILGVSPDDPRYGSCQQLGSTIEAELNASKDPLRQAIVKVLNYDDADIEEYAMLICDVIRLLPPEEQP